mgnify:CR=1 FL=1
MALFMPANITPSTLGALGNGTIDAMQGLTVSWQVNGQNAMTAFEIKVMENTAQSTVLYDTGKKTDGCPFWGTDAAGNTVFFQYAVSAAALSSAGISNGNTYKLAITQWWSDTESVTQQSAAVFLCRSTPVLTIDTFTQPVDNSRFTWTASYTQAQGDAVVWVRWQIKTLATDTVLRDTGNIATGQFSFTYDGLFDGASYAVKCETETVNGVRAETPWTPFAVEYGTGYNRGAVTTKPVRALNGIEVSWPNAIDIPGTATGDYTIADGKLTLPEGSSVTWGETAQTAGSWFIRWDGVVNALPCDIFSFTTEDGVKVTASIPDGMWDYWLTGGRRYRGLNVRTNASESIPDMYVPLSGADKRWNAPEPGDRIVVTMIFPSGSGKALYAGVDLYKDFKGTLPGEDQLPSETLYPEAVEKFLFRGGNTLDRHDVFGSFGYEQRVSNFVLNGSQTCDYLWVRNGAENPGTSPQFDDQTVMLADFAGGDLNAGTSELTDLVDGWAVYRLGEGKSVLELVARLTNQETRLTDSAARRGVKYRYYVFGTKNGAISVASISSGQAAVPFWDWVILDCREDDEGVFHPKQVFLFSLNVTSGTVDNNNAPNLLQNYTRYPLVQLSPWNYRSGKLSGYIGSVGTDGEYTDSISLRDALYGLSTSEGTLFLKNRKGDLIRVAVNGSIAMDTKDETRQQAQIGSVPWVETGAADDVKIVTTSADALWQQ